MFTNKSLLRRCAAFLCLALFSACKTIPIKDTTECVVAGILMAGADCATTNSSQTSEMDFEQFVEFLEPQPERPDPARPGKMLPERAGAVCRSDDDFTAQKTALESACALLRKRCTPEMKTAIGGMNRVSNMLQEQKQKKQGPL